jgi:ABC-type phosphate transport system substrate-binding protein
MRRLISLLVLTTLPIWLQADAVGFRVTFSDPPPAEQQVPSEPLAIVVNRSNPVDDLSSSDLREIFLAYRSHWKNGRRITLVMRESGEPESKTILRDVCGMNEDQFKTHFLHGLYTGEILVSPKTLATPTGVREFVFNVPGAIGYVRFGDVDSSVKVLRIDELLPGEKGYKLRVQSAR